MLCTLDYIASEGFLDEFFLTQSQEGTFFPGMSCFFTKLLCLEIPQWTNDPPLENPPSVNKNGFSTHTNALDAFMLMKEAIHSMLLS